MGKIRKTLVAVAAHAAGKRKANKKQLVLSVVSLILTFTVLVSATYCWFALAKGKGTTDNINLIVGNGLRVNDLGDTQEKFKDNSFLYPASSVDGRNLFFPADGTDFSTVTLEMTFRSANAGDRNYDYVQLDFNLTAEADYTSIYLDKDTSLKIAIPEDSSNAYKEQAAIAEKALRMAIYYDGMDAPVVFTSQMNPCSLDAVKDIDRTTGRLIEIGKQLAVPFKDYSYGKRQLAMLNQGETRPFSLIIWLEGSYETNCISQTIMLKQLVLNLKFTTSWDNTAEIKFEDDTENNAVRQLLNENPAYSLILDYGMRVYDYNTKTYKTTHMKFTMQKETADPNNTVWKCNLPGTATSELTFQIVDGSSSNAVIHEWTKTSSGASTLDRGTATQYFADTLNSTNSYGRWYDGEIATHGEGYDGSDVDDDDW